MFYKTEEETEALSRASSFLSSYLLIKLIRIGRIFSPKSAEISRSCNLSWQITADFLIYYILPCA